jgi:hypothetical protein
LMGASASALLLFVPAAGGAPASSVARASARRPRLARPENDGGNNASADDNRTDAPDPNGVVRALDADHERSAGLPGRLGRTRKRARQPRPCPPPAGPPRPIARLAARKAARASHARLGAGSALRGMIASQVFSRLRNGEHCTRLRYIKAIIYFVNPRQQLVPEKQPAAYN